MIVTLKGRLVEIGQQVCVLEVAGIGYELGISNTSLAELPQIGETVSLYVRMRVNETAISLFGFFTKEERSLFDKLTAISGIGPKVALSILSSYTPHNLAALTFADDVAALIAIPGIGKKTGSRLLVELKNIFSHDSNLASLSGQNFLISSGASMSWENDCVTALVSMGFSSDEANRALLFAKETGTETLESALGKCLKYLGGGAHVGSR